MLIFFTPAILNLSSSLLNNVSIASNPPPKGESSGLVVSTEREAQLCRLDDGVSSLLLLFFILLPQALPSSLSVLESFQLPIVRFPSPCIPTSLAVSVLFDRKNMKM